MEIVSKPDEWGHFDYVLAKKLLADRGKPVSDAQAEALRAARLELLARPDYVSDDGSMRGPISGSPPVLSHLVTSHTRTLPNGQQVYSYSAAQRRRSRIIFLIAVIMIVLSMLMMLINHNI